MPSNRKDAVRLAIPPKAASRFYLLTGSFQRVHNPHPTLHASWAMQAAGAVQFIVDMPL